MPDVIVVGAGPAGLLLAAELGRHGVDVEIFERREEIGDGSRAIGIHSPALERLEPSGVTDIVLAEAVRIRRGEARADGAVLGVVRFDRLARRFPFVASLPQRSTMAAIARLAPPVQRGRRILSVHPEGNAIRVRFTDAAGEHETTAPLVVVATGARGRDLVYRAEALGRHVSADRYLMADVLAHGDDTALVHVEQDGVLESFPLPGGRRRFVAWDAGSADDVDGRTDRLRARVHRIAGPDAAAAITTATTFSVHRVVAPAMRRGRVLAIGDAAHEVSPIGGQGMNLGLLDAVGLAPLLAEWTRSGREPDAGLAAWERARVASARTAARLASVNTLLGRPAPAVGHALRSLALRAGLAGASGRVFTRAYAMGFDRDA